MIGPLSMIAGLGLDALQGDKLSTPTSPSQGSGLHFADILRQGEAAAISGVVGEMPVQQAVEKVLEAERALQTAIAVRDKIVGAYLEISRMQI
jgi:flagellar hook-basal body complex protein FliE